MKGACKNPEAVVKRAVFLAYSASRVCGMGFLQARTGADEDAVWAAATGRTDYGGVGKPGPNRVNCDYVMGRMMKLGLKWDADGIEVDEFPARPDYQSWAVKYESQAALVAAAVASLS